MSSGNSGNGSVLEPTSGNKPPESKTESDYLLAQTEQARAAISKTFNRIQKDLAGGFDPRVWLREHPLATLATAAAGGFAAAATVIPSKEQQELRRLARLERALHPESEHPHPDGKPKHRGIAVRIFSDTVRVLEPALMNILRAMVAEKTTKLDPDDEDADSPAQQSR